MIISSPYFRKKEDDKAVNNKKGVVVIPFPILGAKATGGSNFPKIVNKVQKKPRVINSTKILQ